MSEKSFVKEKREEKNIWGSYRVKWESC